MTDKLFYFDSHDLSNTNLEIYETKVIKETENEYVTDAGHVRKSSMTRYNYVFRADFNEAVDVLMDLLCARKFYIQNYISSLNTELDQISTNLIREYRVNASKN